MFDILLRGARLVDGTGNPWRWADVGIVDAKIAAVGVLKSAKARRIIDVDGRILAPGFIDAHVHLDTTLLLEPMALPCLAQGVTTVIIGQDGLGFAPATKATVSYMQEYLEAFNPFFAFPLAPTGLSVARYLELFADQVAVNVGYLLPHGAIRYNVLGAEARTAKAEELAVMVDQVARGMKEGALGLSTGLEYIPAAFADTAEIIALCAEVSRYGGVYVTHMRDYGSGGPAAVAEVCEIVGATSIKAHISHFNLKADVGLPLIDKARANGLDITIENYPYLAGSTVLSYFLPAWVSVGGHDQTLRRLSDAGVRAKLDAELSHIDWSNIVISFLAEENEDCGGLSGKRITLAAAQQGQSITDFICDLLLTNSLCVGVVQFHTHRDERDLQAVMRHPAQLFGSDGIYRGRHAHPRGWGAFARVLKRYVKELQVLSLPDAIRRMSSHPATRYGLMDRGFVKAGYAADLVVFDLERVADVAAYEQSRQLAVGMDLVMVNGKLVWEDGAFTGEKAGRVLRSGEC